MVEYAVCRDEYREVLSRLDILEHDVADVKAGITDLHHTMDERFDRVNERLERLEARNDQRFAQLEARNDERFDRMNERFDEMYRHISTMTTGQWGR